MESTATRFRSRTLFCAALLMATLAVSGAPPAWGQSLFADPKARAAGDVLTVILAEQTAAQRESGYEGSSEGSIGGSGATDAPGLGGSFSADAEISTEADSRNETVQSDLLEGTMTTRVVDVDEAGNLVLEGERRLNVNGVTHVMTVSGVVRPADVRYDNTVLSHQIADARIEYSQLGFQHRLFSTGTLLKAGAAVALGIAAFLGFS